ncbi:RsmD family RNA methyltransferase, partial [Oenococcus oeni]
MRVIAGKNHGLRLKMVPSKLTRPTTEKVKEALFSIIAPYNKP